MPSLFFLLLLMFTTPTFVHSSLPRRALHHPFFPLLNIPSPNDDFAPPPPTPSPPPFFPSYPSPPPPPPASPTLPSFPTVPVNLSSITTAPSHTRASRYTPRRLAPLIALPAAALAVLLFTLAFLLVHHRRRRLGGAGDCDSHCFFPPNSTASDGRKLSAAPDGRKLSTASSSPAAAASEFLYLGTVVSSRAPAAAASGGGGDTPNDSPYHKLSSPELRPLPPLARHVRRYSSDEEFYSPSGIGSPAADPDASSSCKAFPAEVTGESVSPVSTLSSPSRRSSNNATSPSPSSSPQISSSPRLSNARVPSLGGNVFIPPPPLAPPRVLRPLTPSPPKRNPFAVNMLPKGGKGPPPPPILPPRPIGAKNISNNSDVGENGDDKPRTKLKPLHWDKVHASSDGTMVWDHLRSSSFELNEEMIATLFVYDSANAVAKDASKRQFKASPSQDSMVLDPKKSQNIAILLRALNVTKEEVCGALLEGNTDSLGNELLETLLKMTPNKEEECQLKEYKNDSPFKLGPAEKFLKAVLDIPFAFKRADAMLYIANFEPDVSYLWNSFGTLEAACEELRTSRLFLKLLEAVLKTGNRMNVGTNRGDAEAFKLDTLLKLVDVKGADGKTTLLHFVVQEITKAEGLKANSGSLRDDLESRKLGLQVVAGLGSELSNVKRAASMDSDVLSSYVTKLANGIEKIIEVLRLNSGLSSSEQNQCFHETMSTFLTKAEAEIAKLQARERTSTGLVKELTAYFQGDSGKEEGHPLRTFMVVRDFLFILDKVCKEVGRINERAAVSTAHVAMAVNPAHPSVFPKLHTVRCGSSDDESSCSSST